MRQLYLTFEEFRRLTEILAVACQFAGASRSDLQDLATELYKAKLVEMCPSPPTVVRLYSRVTILPTGTTQERTLRIVLPSESNAETGDYSVLSPIGTALLGRKEGDSTEWLDSRGATGAQVLQVRPPEESISPNAAASNEASSPQPQDLDPVDLAQALRETHDEVLSLQAQLEEYRWIENALRKRTYDLSERVKELDCLYAISDCLRRRRLTLAETLQAIVDVIPTGYQDPERTWAELRVRNEVYLSTGFRKTQHSHAAGIVVEGKRAGVLRVYVAPSRCSDEGSPLLPEEEALLHAIALWVGEMVEHRTVGHPMSRPPSRSPKPSD